MQGSTVDITHMGFMSRANKMKIAANSGYKMVEVAKNELKKNAELVVVLADQPYCLMMVPQQVLSMGMYARQVMAHQPVLSMGMCAR